jgi:CBS domain-containing protein
MKWQVDDVMTRTVITVDPETPVGRIAGLLDREGISAVPVTAAGSVLGIVSQADLLAGVAAGTGSSPRTRKARAARAADLMSGPPLSIDTGTSLARAAETMRSADVRRLLVRGRNGRLLGVVSRSDLLRPYGRDDAAIRSEVEAVVRRRLWIAPEQVGVRVHRGTAVLTGEVGRRSTAAIVARLAAAVPGVIKVADRIRYDFDDTDLIRSRVSRTHPFSAEPFQPGGKPRRARFRSVRMLPGVGKILREKSSV